jgi:hypothetical protein
MKTHGLSYKTKRSITLNYAESGSFPFLDPADRSRCNSPLSTVKPAACGRLASYIFQPTVRQKKLPLYFAQYIFF